MKTNLTVLIALISILTLICFSDNYAALPGDTLRTDTGEIIIVPDYGIPGVDYADSQFIASFLPEYLTLPVGQAEAYLDSCTVEDSLKSILEDHDVYYVEQVFTGAQLGDTIRVVNGDTAIVPDLSQIYLLRQQAAGDVLSAITNLYDHSVTRYAEPNFFLTEAAEPNDPFWNHEETPQWNLKNPDPYSNPPTYGIGCPTAWDVTAGENTIKMGIVDSGVEGDHWDLGGPEFPNDTKLVGGWNYADWNNSIGDASDFDEHGHGTGTAGIAGALTNNFFGMSGITGGWYNEEFPSGAQLYSLKVKHDGGTYSNDSAFRAVAFGSDPELSETSFGCHILNCSLPGAWSEGWEDAVYFAYNVGANVVGARGNTGGPNAPRGFPASINHRNWVISVGSYGKDGRICDTDYSNCNLHGSSYGYGMDLLAPGTDIPFTSKNGGIYADGGTSYATPHVSSAIALLRSSDWDLPFNLTNEDYEWILKYSAYDPTSRESNGESDGDEWTCNERYGHGQLRISTPISRLTDPDWSLTDYTATGALSAVYPLQSYIFRSISSGRGLEGTYTVQKYRCTIDVNYPFEYSDIPYAWGIGHGTVGWSAGSPNYQIGWCRFVPGSQRIDGCILETYVYKVNVDGRWYWYPCAPGDVSLEYRVWGIPSQPSPKAQVQLLPGEISLLGNYPNPFNASTSIEFSIPNESHVVLSIFDIIGRKVNTLVDKDVAAGEYSVVWDGTDSKGDEVSSGIYYSRLEVADQVKTVKMTMLK